MKVDEKFCLLTKASIQMHNTEKSTTLKKTASKKAEYRIKLSTENSIRKKHNTYRCKQPSKQASNIYLFKQVGGSGSYAADVDLQLGPLERIPWVFIHRPRKGGQLSCL